MADTRTATNDDTPARTSTTSGRLDPAPDPSSGDIFGFAQARRPPVTAFKEGSEETLVRSHVITETAA